MVNNLKINKNWIATLCLLLCSLTSFSQEFSDATIGFDTNKSVTFLKQQGASDQEITNEIIKMRKTQTNRHIAFKKNEDKILQKIKSNLISKSGANRKSSTTEVPQTEKDALYELFSQTNGQSWRNSWNFATNVESYTNEGFGWYGITVTNGHVTSIILHQNNLNGTIPNLSDLPFLEVLSLEENNLTGDLTNFKYLSSLKILNLSQNNFTGPLTPIEHLLNIESLSITNNRALNSTIPDSFYKLKKLKSLSLFYLGSSDGRAISHKIGQLINLESLSLTGNFGTGVPIQLSNLKKLKWLRISGINGGTFPEELCNLTQLEYLLLEGNKLQGTLPKNLGKLVHLIDFSVAGNKLERELPSITKLTEMKNLDVRYNKFRFIDFDSQHTRLNNDTLAFRYQYQDKTDTEKILAVSNGGSVTLSMYEDKRCTNEEQYQWFKGIWPSGDTISNATRRQYTISNFTPENVGDYYCISTHPKMTKKDYFDKNLTLQRNSIHLILGNCPTIQGLIKSDSDKFYTNAENKFLFETTQNGLSYEWSVTPEIGTVPSNRLESFSFSFSEPGYYVITLVVKDANGCATTFTKPVALEDRYCTRQPINFTFNTSNPNLNYTWTTTNPAGQLHTEVNSTGRYTLIPQVSGQYIVELGASNSTSCETLFSKIINVENCSPVVASCTQSNPLTPKIHRLFIDLINKLTSAPDAANVSVYAKNEITSLIPYTTGRTAKIYKFVNNSEYISFSFLENELESDVYIPKSPSGSIIGIDLSNYINSQTATTVTTNYTDGSSDSTTGKVKNINFCPEAECTPIVGILKFVSTPGPAAADKKTIKSASKI